jgi:hypothetical protein
VVGELLRVVLVRDDLAELGEPWLELVEQLLGQAPSQQRAKESVFEVLVAELWRMLGEAHGRLGQGPALPAARLGFLSVRGGIPMP